jgi:hypothetical protein
MKQKKFEQLLVVMEVFDDCGSTVFNLQQPVLNSSSYESLRMDMLKILENDLGRLKKEIFKL